MTPRDSADDFRPLFRSGGHATWDLLSGIDEGRIADLQIVAADVPVGHELAWRDRRGRLVSVIREGWACREIATGDGQRQIVGIMMGADPAGAWTPPAGKIDHAVRTLTPCRILTLSAERLLELAEEQREVGVRLERQAHTEMARLHAWMFNIGQRKAPERLAQLICELAGRTDEAGGPQHWLPLKQQDLADALGMTSVHVNRILQRFRAEGLVEARKGGLRVKDAAALARLCDPPAADSWR